MAPGYQPLPTEDNNVFDPDVPYKHTGQDFEDRQTRLKRQHTLRKIITCVVIMATLAVGFFAKEAISTISKLARCGFRSSCCHQGMGGAGNRTYHAQHTLPTHYVLPSGDKIPSVALGVWKAASGEVGAAVKTALDAGYRHIDGAWIYGNEAEVGQALRESNVSRSDLWLTSKLWNSFHSPEDVEPVLDQSLERLGTDYLDLYLIHWPVSQNRDGTVNWPLTENPYPTWQKLEELVEKGKIRNIGISNFNIRRIQNLTANPLKIKPAVNQVELNFWNPQPELVKWSKENGVLLEAYSPLGSDKKVSASLNVPEVKAIAKTLGITPAQVIISWQLQRGNIVLPKSVTPSRIVENYQVVEIPQDLFEQLENAAASHKPERSVDPDWGVDIWN